MPVSTSRLAYSDCYDLLDKAIADKRGARVRVKNENLALHLRGRLNKARYLDREENLIIYQRGEPLHGRSVYDPLVITITEDDDGWTWVRLEKRDMSDYYVESLSEGEEDGEYESIGSDNGATPVEEEARVPAEAEALSEAKERRRA